MIRQLICVSVCAILTFLTAVSAAELQQIWDYRLHQHRNPNVRFAMAVTSNHDVLTLVMTADGKWRLTRLHGWLEANPIEQTIVVRGLSDPKRGNWLAPWEARLLVTSDGRYAVCAASGLKKGGVGSVQIVSIVDLSAFQVIQSETVSELPWFSGRSPLIQFDRTGNLVLRASDTGNRYDVRIGLYSMPPLNEIDRCQYTEQPIGADRVHSGEENCADLIARSNGTAASLEEFLNSLRDSSEKRQRYKATWGYFTLYLSSDGRFGHEQTYTRSRGLWGVKISDVAERIFSTKSEQEIASVNLSAKHTFESRFATKNGRDYFIIVEDGWRFRVYEIPTR